MKNVPWIHTDAYSKDKITKESSFLIVCILLSIEHVYTFSYEMCLLRWMAKRAGYAF